MTDAAGIQARLQALRDSYAAQLPAKIGEIRMLWEKLCRIPAPEDLKTLHRLVHSLTGSGDTFGYAELSDAARVMEACLKEMQEHNTSLDTPCCDRVNAYLQAVESVALAERAKAQNLTPPASHVLPTEEL